MTRKIYLDMDGTIADLYGVNGWLDMLINENEEPYKIAKELVSEDELINLIDKGYSLNIISWLSKNSTKEYDKKVRNAKKEWLKEHYPNIKFDEIHIVKYGTNKKSVANDKTGILVDDEKPNRDRWGYNSIVPDMISSL